MPRAPIFNAMQTTQPLNRNGTFTARPIPRKPTPNTNKASGKSGGVNLNKREMPVLDWIHVIFLFYSGAHNAINAWNRAENGLFFIFVLVGILSVELMLWGIYKYWKSGHLIGKMLRVGKLAGFLALFFATAGILAQAQTGAGGWLDIYYAWILPASAPVMFFFAFWIQSVDPIMTHERDVTAYSYLTAIEEKKESLDNRRMLLNEKRSNRKLRAHVMRKKISALWRESDSRRTKSTLAKSSVVEMPLLLEEVGVNVKKANAQSRYLAFKGKYDTPKQLPKPKNSAINPRQMPGSDKQVK